MAPVDEKAVLAAPSAPEIPPMYKPPPSADDFVAEVDEVTAQIQGIIDGTITDFDAFDQQLELKERAKRIKEEEAKERYERAVLFGREGKGEGRDYKWWCKRCFVEYRINLSENKCTRCKQSDKMMTQEARREELFGKLEIVKGERIKHQWRKDKWTRWKRSQALLKRSKYINYKAWEYWEPDTDTEDEGDPIVPKDNPEFRAMEADMHDRKKKSVEKQRTSNKCRERGNESMKSGDFTCAIDHYAEGLEYTRADKKLWTNKALAEIKVFRWHDAVASCNKVIEYSEIFEEGFTKSRDSCFKAFTRRATALRALHRWDEALEDLDDALKLFPKDKDALNLRRKTQVAVEEHKQAQRLQEQSPSANKSQTEEPPVDEKPTPDGIAAAKMPAQAEHPPIPKTSAPQLRPDGSVRIEIEESDGESEQEEAARASHEGSLGRISKTDFSKLMERLGGSEKERVLFCTRKVGNSLVKQPTKSRNSDDDWQSRKLDLSVEEVAEPSSLDNVLRDVERCCMLWRKTQQGGVVPLRPDVAKLAANEMEDKEAASFVQVAVPRVLSVLHLLASNSDHHCELTVFAVRHVWPLLAEPRWRHAVLELFAEWSQRPLCGKAMAEFAGRHPDPHLRLFLDAIIIESKENMLPQNFDSFATGAAAKMEGSGEKGLDAALDMMLQGLKASSPAELAVATYGNLCVAGNAVPAFKEHMAPFCKELVGALARHVKPLNWRLCGRTAGAISNTLRLGGDYPSAVHGQCLEPILRAIRQENSLDESGRIDEPKSAHGIFNCAFGDLANGMPKSKSTGRLLGAVVNLLIVKPSVAEHAVQLGALQMAAPLMDADVWAGCCHPIPVVDVPDEAPHVVAARAALLASRLVSAAPNSFAGTPLEADLLRRLDAALQNVCRELGITEQVKAAGTTCEIDSMSRPAALEMLDLAVRMLVAILTRTSGALERLTAEPPRIEELPDGCDSLPERMEPAVPFNDLCDLLISVTKTVHPRDYLGPDDESGIPSRIRGNLALLFTRLCKEQQTQGAPRCLVELNLGLVVPTFVECLRKDRGPAQHNAGVCVTELARNERYKEQVRDLKGFESLHQIQLPKVEALKEEAMRQHRKRGPELKGMD